MLVWQYPLPHAKSDQRVWLKLTDYGISRKSNEALLELRISKVNGTPGYIAPEVLLGRNDLQADKVHLYIYIANYVLHIAMLAILRFKVCNM